MWFTYFMMSCIFVCSCLIAVVGVLHANVCHWKKNLSLSYGGDHGFIMQPSYDAQICIHSQLCLIRAVYDAWFINWNHLEDRIWGASFDHLDLNFMVVCSVCCDTWECVTKAYKANLNSNRSDQSYFQWLTGMCNWPMRDFQRDW